MSQVNEIISPFAGTARLIRRRWPAPTARQWALHGALLLVTLATTTFSGVSWLVQPETGPGQDTVGSNWIEIVLELPRAYALAVVSEISNVFAHPHALVEGLLFSGSLLAILASHEAGHYLFCRYYGVDATLPFFIPQPPLLLPGTFGAFIRMKSPVPSRRALFDIGLAGPLAGFVVIIPVALVAILTVQPANIPPGVTPDMVFNDPLLFRLIARAFGRNLDNAAINPFYLAAWIGMLVTSLNLMPVGQLDGGHGTFAVFGETLHRWIARIAFITMVVVSLLGWFWHGSPTGFVYVVLLAVMLRVRHPPPEHNEPLGAKRLAIGVVTLIVFVLCFLPFPITLR